MGDLTLALILRGLQPFLVHASLKPLPSIFDLTVYPSTSCHILGKRVDLMQEKVSSCLPLRGFFDAFRQFSTPLSWGFFSS